MVETSQLHRQTRQLAVTTTPSGSMRPGLLVRCATGSAFLINTGAALLAARVLGPQACGSYLFVQWMSGMLIPLLGASMSPPTMQQIARLQVRETPRVIAGIFYALWYRQHRRILLYSLACVLSAFIGGFLFHTGSPRLLLLAGLGALPLMLSTVVGTTLRGLHKTFLLALLNFFNAFLTLLLLLLASQARGATVEAFLLANALANTLTLVLAVACLMRLLPLRKATAPGIFLQERLAISLQRSWMRFCIDFMIWEHGEFLLLACWCDPAEVGYYALSALSSAALIRLAPIFFTDWIIPLFSHSMPAHHYLNAHDAFLKTSLALAVCIFPLCTLLVILCPDIVSITLGETYLPMVPSLRILLAATAFGSVATVSLTHLANSGQGRRQQWPDLGVAAFKLFLAVPLILAWGITGAALASAVTQIASACLAVIACRRLLLNHGSGRMAWQKP